MKKINLRNIDKKKLESRINKIPYIFIWILMFTITPIGVWFFIVRVKENKRKMYNWGRNLTGIGLFILFIVGVGLYSFLKDVIDLYNSGMSLDMINLIPEDVHLYIIGIIMLTSFIIGGRLLVKKARIEQIYTKSINLEHETSIKKISEKLNLYISNVKKNILDLKDKDYLIPIEIDDKKNKIIYKDKGKDSFNTKEISKKKQKVDVVQCKKCGAIVPLKLDEYVECDFCGNGLIGDDNN